MSWLFVPRLRADGWLRIGGQEHRFEDDLAYHDHNWGRFWWGDDFGWTWGTILPREPDDPWSMVFLQMTDRRRLRFLSQALYVWHHDEPAAIFRHAAVQTHVRSASRPRSGLHPAAPDATAPRRRGAGRAGTRRDHRDTGGRHRARRVSPAVLRPPRAAQRDPSRPVDRAVRDQRYRPGRAASISGEACRLRRHRRIRVPPWLNRFRRCCGARSSISPTRCPTAIGCCWTALGPMVVELDVDGELFSLRGGDRLEVSDGAARLGTCPDHHLPRRHPRRARRQGRTAATRSKPAPSACAARSTTSCARTTRCSPTCTRGPGTVAAGTAGRTPGGRRHEPQLASRRRRRANPRPTVAVLGAGIAGLTAAHELAERGFDVTVYEIAQDERNGLGTEPAGTYPPVKLGGLAASQYSTVGTHDGSPAELRPFPGRRGQPRPPGGRSRVSTASASSRRTTYTSGTCSSASRSTNARDGWRHGHAGRRPRAPSWTTSGGWSPRERRWTASRRSSFPARRPRSPGRVPQRPQPARRSWASPRSDIADLREQIAALPRHQSAAPRARNCRTCRPTTSSSDATSDDGDPRFSYSPRFDALPARDATGARRIRLALGRRPHEHRPRTSSCNCSMDRRDNKADGVLNGPTTESWFDHWYRHLVALGVRFVHGAARLPRSARVRPEPATPPATAGAGHAGRRYAG